MTAFWVGVDGGGTKTAVCIVNGEGEVVGTAVTGASNWNSVGAEAARQQVFQGVQQALALANAGQEQVNGVCFAMSGVDRETDRVMVKGWATEYFTNKDTAIHVYSDAVSALTSGTLGNMFGVVVISGTGTISYGIDLDKKHIRSAGWGPLLGDEGSGYDIGSRILKAVTDAADGRGPATALTQLVLQHLSLSEASDLIGWAYQDTQWSRFASLAPLAAQAIRDYGDEVATNILNTCGSALVKSIESVITRGRMGDGEPIPVVLAGGNLTHEQSYLSRVVRRLLAERVPDAQVTTPQVDAAQAGALLAMKL